MLYTHPISLRATQSHAAPCRAAPHQALPGPAEPCRATPCLANIEPPCQNGTASVWFRRKDVTNHDDEYSNHGSCAGRQQGNDYRVRHMEPSIAAQPVTESLRKEHIAGQR